MNNLMEFDGFCYALYPPTAENDNTDVIYPVDEALADQCALWVCAGLIVGSMLGMCWSMYLWPVPTVVVSLVCLATMMALELLWRRR